MNTVTEKTRTCRDHLQIYDCGLGNYRSILQLQQNLVEKRQHNNIADTVLIAEHNPVITLGARQSCNKLLVGRDVLKRKHIDVVEIRRGGGSTAHNPGQLVIYPILHLRELGLGINEYIRKLESIGAVFLKCLDVEAEARKDFPGLWVGEKKISSIGVRVSRSVTYHGIAVNIQNDLSIFDYIAPCGLDNIEMTSVFKETGKRHLMSHTKERMSELIKRHFS